MGKAQKEESTSLDWVPDRLDSLLPSRWTAKLSKTKERHVDGVLTLTAPTGERARFTIEVKHWSTAPSSAVAGVLANVQRRTADPVILVTDYVNPPLRRACDELGIGYIDATGWVSITLDRPLIAIRAAGADRPPRRRGSNTVVRLNGIAVGRNISVLLEAQPPIGVTELSKRANTSPASVSKLLPTLATAGAIERDERGQVVDISRRLLLQRWTQDYTYFNGNGVVLDFLAPRGLIPVLDRLADADEASVTGSFAGRSYLDEGTVPVVPPSVLTLYAADPRRLADEIGLTRIDRPASNVIIAAPRDRRLLARSRPNGEGVPIAPLPQVLADLIGLPGRESLLAEQLMDQLARSDPLWREA